MESRHIDDRKLYDAIRRLGALEPEEVQHLWICDECLSQLRILVKRHVRSTAGRADR
jgi:hypothetical protein